MWQYFYCNFKSPATTEIVVESKSHIRATQNEWKKHLKMLFSPSCASVVSYMPKWRWCIMCAHASECAYVQKTLCDGAFSSTTELWTTGFVVCLGSQGGSWMMLPQLSEERPRLAGSRTALTGYHSRNCGLCPDSLEKIKEKREGGVKAVSKGLGRVSLFQEMLEHCVATPWKPVSTMAPV